MPRPLWQSALLAWPISRSSASTRISGSASEDTTASRCRTSAKLHLHGLITGIAHCAHHAVAIFGTQRDHRTAATAAGELGAQRAVVTRDLQKLLDFPARHLQGIQLALADVHQ